MSIMEQLTKHILLVLLLCLLNVGVAFAQKTEFKKADALYRVHSYAEAIPLYEKGLAIKNSKSARSKLAFCYKTLNQIKKAEKLYAQLITEERVRPDNFFYYGEVLMSQGKYQEAKTWFLKFHELEPDEEKGMRMAESCDQIPFLTPIFPEATVMDFPYNTDFDDSSPVLYNNELVFSSDRKTGVKLLKQKSGATGRDFIRLYSSKLNDQNEWSKPKSFSGKLNEHNKNNANASFLPDGSEVYFTRNGNTSNRKNAFTLQLHSAKKEKGKWKKIEVVSVCRNAYNYMHPAISPDGKTLFFISDKPGGKGGTDIFYTQKKGDKWGKAINMDSTINTSAHEGFPFMNTDGKLYFCSKGHIGYGGFDIFVTEKLEDGSWSKPVNVGQPINSSMDDISIFLNAENTRGAFTSSRKKGDDDIFIFALDGSIPTSDEVAPSINENTLVEAPAIEKTSEVDIVKETSEIVEKPVVQTPEAKDIPKMETTAIEKISEVDIVSETEVITEMRKPINDPIENGLQKVVGDDALAVSEISSSPPSQQHQSGSSVETTETPNAGIQQNTSGEVSREAMSPKSFQKAVNKGKYEIGMYYILEKMNYFPGEYLLAPKMTLQLEPIAKMMLAQPALQLEVSVHTESIGYDENNLTISQKRAKAIKNYLLYKGVETKRIVAIGMGETKPLNHCANGVACEEEEHMANQRVEVRVW
ncbi:MAG: outer membrane protein OmpA-like peptidoglycan-associated protein [Patescibacteria group bacterium]|jgi:outer membrane protein OmpA-like peptidoglycan-associated protein/tetratricopeptide (TPR) repeat protein